MTINNLNTYFDQLSHYTELRVQENKTMQITFLKGNIIQNTKESRSGVSARVYKNGSWGFASSPEMDEDNIKAIIKHAEGNAAFLDFREKKNRSPLQVKKSNVEMDLRTKNQKLSQSQLMDFIKEIDAYISKKYKNLSERMLTLKSLTMEKNLITSGGTSLYSMLPRTNIIISMTMDKNNEPVQLFDIIGGLGEFEDNFSTPMALYEKIDSLYEHLAKKSEGVYATSGLKECVMDADLAGILAHEAIGHTTEADLVLGGSVASNYLNQLVASPIVSLVDFANTYDGQICPIPIYIDDEGTEAQDSVIIENGILKGYMHNRGSARHFGVEPTGNARAFEYFDEPLIRMRNTAILPGKSKLEEMLSSIDDGYYLMKSSNGQADTTSEFMFGVVLGYEIKNGKLGKAIKDTTISGIAFEVLKSTTMISDEMRWSSGGMCGKKQWIPVGMGGPAVKCTVNIGGR